MNLFAKGKGGAAPAAKAPTFAPIDRFGMLGLLDQIVNGNQSGVLQLREPRGEWTYAFQGGALTHASGGRVRGARQAFDLLWEFQAGEFIFTPGVNPSLAGNLYIDKGRLLDLLRRSQAVLQGPSAPYIPPDQQRAIAPVPRPYSPPSPAQMPPAWQPGMQQQPPQPAWGYPQQQVPGQPYPGAPVQQPYPAPPGQPQPFAAQQPPAYPGAPAQPFPAAPFPQVPTAQPPLPPQALPPVRGAVRGPIPAAPAAPAYPGFPQQPMPGQAPMMPQQPMPQPAAPYQAQPQVPYQAMPVPPAPPQQVPLAAQPAPARRVTPPTFSVPPMPIPKKAQQPVYAPPTATPPVAPAAPEAPKAAPNDDLAALRASLVAQAPAIKPAAAAPAWSVRKADGTVAPVPVVEVKGKGKGKGKAEGGKKKGDSKLMAAIKVQLIKFLLWACERRYDPEDHWTLKDAFEVSTMELRDQFFGAFSQTFAASKKSGRVDDDMDDMAAGRMRGRGRRH